MISRGLVVLQALGLPAPPGYAVVMPKYVACASSAWRAGPLPLCRVIDEYGPRGLGSALDRAGARTEWDPAYSAPMPYMHWSEALLAAHPQEALHHALQTGDGEVAAVVWELTRAGVPLEDMGLTGSHALSFHVPGVSDVDIVVYGPDAAEAAYHAFKARRPASPPRRSVGGLAIEPPWPTGWRRALVDGVAASWMGAPREGPAKHCPPLNDYPPRDPPDPQRCVRLEVSVEPGQASALLYPPCVEAGEGLWVVSFEYNIAGPLYEGGVLLVEGVASARGGAVYLGTRECPGRVRALRLTRPG